METVCRVAVQYHNQGVDMDVIHRAYSDFPCFNCARVYVVVSSPSTRAGLYIHHRSLGSEQVDHLRRPLVLFFFDHTHFSAALSPARP